MKGKAVIVTGGGGSIGSEICDRVATFGAARLLVIENSEPALYAVTEALTARETSAVIEGRIADIRDRERIMRLMTEFKPDIVFHAAALKHVPILERDWSEGVKTNIFGSVNVADAALAAGAEAMVMISTDKAIEPVSMLGLTKRFAEMYCQALDHDLAAQSGRQAADALISVRFGNVLASNGSVVPKFKAQIEAGGPVTVTHPDMVRYFMTIREACDLVLTAATHALTPARGRCLGLRAQHGAAGQDRRSGRAHDPPVRPGARPRYRDRVHRHAAGRAAERNPVRQRGADRRDRRRRHHGGQAQRAADADAAEVDRGARAGDCERRSDDHQGHSEGCGPGIRFDCRVAMPAGEPSSESIDAKPAKIVVVSQHYPPDPSTTAAIMAAIADHLAAEAPVLVLSGMPGSADHEAINLRTGRPSSKSRTGCRRRPR